MTKYNYFENVKEDVKEWIKENYGLLADFADDNGDWLRDDNRDEVTEAIYEECWVNDLVTGNASGSYTFNTWQAEENLCHNLDLLAEACEEFGSDVDLLKSGAEACDVTIRCHLLRSAIDEVLDEMLED